MGSKVLRAASHGALPELFPVLVENQGRLFRGDKPDAACEFTLELAGRPARIAEENEALLRSPVVADVAQDLGRRGHRHAPVNVDGFGAAIIGAVDDKADLRRHRTAREHAHAAVGRVFLLTERLENTCERTLSQWPIEDE